MDQATNSVERSGAAHTPGPWFADGPPDNIHILQEACGHIRICFLTSNGPTEANARLIAAAPELVEPFAAADNGDWRALDLLLGHSGHGQFWREVFEKFRPALAKATAA